MREEQILTLSDRVQYNHEVIIPALREGKIIICDRYLYTSIANMQARGYRGEAWFFDVSSPLSSALESNYKTENRLFLDGSKIFCELKFKSNKRYMYYYTTEFEEAKTVVKIIFPDNYFMHVFAITTEDQ